MKGSLDKYSNPIGTSMHHACNFYLSDYECYANSISEEIALEYVDSFINYETEYKISYSGTTCILDIVIYNNDGTVDIIDIKSGRLFGDYNNYYKACVQLSKYKMIYMNTHKAKVRNLLIANISDRGYKIYHANDLSNLLALEKYGYIK